MTYNQKHLNDVARLHRVNILKSLEHRLQVARAKGKSRGCAIHQTLNHRRKT